jgi:hypothetical protein
MYICILKNEFISLLGYKSIRVAKNRAINEKSDLRIFSHAPNIKIGDSTGQIILELKEDFSKKEIYLNDDQVKTLRLDQVACCHLIKADEDFESLCVKHKLSIKDDEFKDTWKKWLASETSRTCYEYSLFVSRNINGEQVFDELILQNIIKALFTTESAEANESDACINLLKRTFTVIDSARECINQNQYSLIELPLVLIEESLGIEIEFDEIESNTDGIYPRLMSDRLKSQKFYGQLITDSEARNFYKYLSQTYPTVFNKRISPLGATTYFTSCDQIFTKSFNPHEFEKNIKRLSINSNPEEAFLIAFMVAAQLFIKDII